MTRHRTSAPHLPRVCVSNAPARGLFAPSRPGTASAGGGPFTGPPRKPPCGCTEARGFGSGFVWELVNRVGELRRSFRWNFRTATCIFWRGFEEPFYYAQPVLSVVFAFASAPWLLAHSLVARVADALNSERA